MLKRLLRVVRWFVLLTILLPIAIGGLLGYAHGWPPNWRGASWASSGLLPEAAQVQPASVILLASRTGRWKGIFAEHMSIVLKRAGDRAWTRYDVVGWGTPVRKNAYVADAYWYGNAPRVIYRMDGAEAEQLIPTLEHTIAAYPY